MVSKTQLDYVMSEHLQISQLRTSTLLHILKHGTCGLISKSVLISSKKSWSAAVIFDIHLILYT